MNIEKFWKDVLAQNAEAMKMYFHENAYVNWHCTNEHFNVEEFIRANCEYPGEWDGEIERKHCMGDLLITVTHVYTKDKTLSFHVTSFFKIKEDKILSVDEYWGDDGKAPQWRQEKHIGTAIR
ncbi:MAG: nuclear transport factor 2 family protein [Roseburia sp.]|nr:nuclear transport factor 2 family protein [Roseburia sp.]